MDGKTSTCFFRAAHGKRTSGAPAGCPSRPASGDGPGAGVPEMPVRVPAGLPRRLSLLGRELGAGPHCGVPAFRVGGALSPVGAGRGGVWETGRDGRTG